MRSSGRSAHGAPGPDPRTPNSKATDSANSRRERTPVRLRRRPIEPLCIVDDADERLLLGHLRQQAQHCQTDQKAVRCISRAEPERGTQRIALRPRQRVEPIQHLPAQLMQAGERKLHFGLDTCSRARRDTLRPARGRIPTTRFCRRRPRRAPRALHSGPPARPRAADLAPRTRFDDPSIPRSTAARLASSGGDVAINPRRKLHRAPTDSQSPAPPRSTGARRPVSEGSPAHRIA